MSLVVAILGRPNVGKSTLFNRLVGSRAALVDDTPGVTRDRREGDGRIADLEFRAIDTAGLEEAAPASLAGRMQAQTERALADADVALLVDRCARGRHRGRPAFCQAGCGAAASRWSSSPTRPKAARPYPASAKPIGSVSAIRCRFRPSTAKDWPSFTSGWCRSAASARAAAGHRTGRAGKAACNSPSSAARMSANRPWSIGLIGEERLLTGPEAGITRDAIAIDWAVAGPADPPCRHRRDAPPAAGRRQDRAALGRRCAAHDTFCRDRGPGARRVAAARAAGFDDSPAGRRGRSGIGSGRDQMGRGRERRRGHQSSCATGCRSRSRSFRASPSSRYRG